MATNLEILNQTAAAKAVSPAIIDFMKHMMAVESGGKSNAQNADSSACGLCQFIDQTWLGMMHDKGAANGYGDLASHIHRGADGKWHGDSPAIEQHILALKKDPTASIRMGVEYALSNEAALHARSHEVTPATLYLAHFLGSGGANAVLGADPSASIAGILGAKVMGSNANVRLDYIGKDEKEKTKYFANFTVGDLQSWATKKMGGHIRYDLLDREVQDNVAPWKGDDERAADNFRAIGNLSMSEAFGMLLFGMLASLFAGVGTIQHDTVAENHVAPPAVPTVIRSQVVAVTARHA